MLVPARQPWSQAQLVRAVGVSVACDLEVWVLKRHEALTEGRQNNAYEKLKANDFIQNY